MWRVPSNQIVNCDGFSPRQKYETFTGMIWTLVLRMLAIVAVVGLLLAPMTMSSGAGAMLSGSSASMADMTAMAGAMPCCPEGKSSVPDRQKSCPLAIVCIAKCFPNAPGTAAIVLGSLPVAAAILPGNELARDLLAEPPPSRPPRA